MDIGVKSYYRAIVYYYIADAVEEAQQECYKALEYSPRLESAAILSQAIRRYSKNKYPRINEKVKVLLSLIEQEDMDTFLMLLFSENDPDSFVASRIDWNCLAILEQPKKTSHKIWAAILQKDFQQALLLAKTSLLADDNKPIVCFQMGYTLYLLQKFLEAEVHFFQLVEFQQLYAVSAVNMLLRLPRHHFSSLASRIDIILQASQKEKFLLAYALQQSWDNKGRKKYLRVLAKSAKDNATRLLVADIFLQEGLWGKAAILWFYCLGDFAYVKHIIQSCR